MATLRFALAQFDFPVGAVAANATHVRTLMDEARAAGCDLIAFPELTLCGYPPEDLLLRPSFLAACARELDVLAAEARGIAAYVGHPHTEGEVFNAASLLAEGRIALTYRKQALPNYTVFDEKRYFRPGHESAAVEIAGVRIGLLICEDIWEAEPAAQAAAAGAELLLVINASPFDTRQAALREELLARRACENRVAIAYVNVVGGQDDLLFDGASLLVEADGHVVARAPAFADALLVAEYDSATGRFSIDSGTRVGFSRDAVRRNRPSTTPDSVIYTGLVRAIRDYVGKNGFPGVVLGLSGGVDSALTLALAVDALGADKVTAVRLPSRYTSDLSNALADEQARALGVHLLTLPVEAPFTGFLTALAPAAGPRSSALGAAPDATEENLQARSRGALLMALSNRFGWLLLSTGNKSEMAVGYATLYGDMCGGFAPLKDVYKTMVFRLARWRNETGIENRESGIGEAGWAIPPAVIERPPTAELRENQTDQDTLPPYDVLDAILERFIEGEQAQAEIVAAGFDEATVRRIARLVLASEYKRRQSAPGPRISTRAFGRDRRYPISSGWL